jgi:antitoxin ParD1/3/4
MHVSLTPALEEQVRLRVESGLYNNASEVIRESLRLMLERDVMRQRLQAEVNLGAEQLQRGEKTTVNSKEEFMALVRRGR